MLHMQPETKNQFIVKPIVSLIFLGIKNKN